MTRIITDARPVVARFRARCCRRQPSAFWTWAPKGAGRVGGKLALAVAGRFPRWVFLEAVPGPSATRAIETSMKLFISNIRRCSLSAHHGGLHIASPISSGNR